MSLEQIEQNQKQEEDDYIQVQKSELEIILKQIDSIRNQLRDLKK